MEKRNEIKQRSLSVTVLMLSLCSFLLAFNYFVLRVLKEIFLVTSPEAGVEAIPFVKTWCLFPLSILFLAGFTSLARSISLRFAVNGIIFFFLASYALFAFVCLPLGDQIHLHSFAGHLQQYLPSGWRALAGVVRYWDYSLFYVTAECWCTLIYSVVFWGYANAIMNFNEAKKYYPYLTLAGTLAALVAGPLTIFLTGSGISQLFSGLQNDWKTTFCLLISLVIVCGMLAIFLFHYFCPPIPRQRAFSERTSSLQSFAKVFRSQYLLVLAGVALSLNYVLNLVDVVWKSEVLKFYPTPEEFASYLSHVTLLTGIFSTLFAALISRRFLQRYGWTRTALITPSIILATSILFFTSLYGQMEWKLSFLPVSLSVFLGGVHVCLSCSAKYTLFEPIKEMALIPLPQEEKLHGKAVIDGLSARVGRTSSSITYQILLIFLPTIAASGPYIATLSVGVILLSCLGILFVGRSIEGEKEPVTNF